MADLHCPNCGTSFGPQLARVRMMNCSSCGTTAVLEDEVLRLAGEQGVMHDGPQLVHLGRSFELGGDRWTPRGQARFSYGRGTWDEFWIISGTGREGWLSVDEGDVALQFPLPPDSWPRLAPQAALGATVQLKGRSFRLTETETATCEAIRGSFPEVLAVGETYSFVNLAGAGDQAILSGEFWPGGQIWFLGNWIDPWDIREAGA